ncbi:hypothetical protein [Methylobacterium sp. E-045]|uniref:hypothetical protein n=1 Tax=Methylobacterium sp. E-045 TaxID=2836575 RepID=UPI001FBA5A80|nr:hypothetical protein [Methylobacterium sp. E-045]MCJ2127999.1 hypothetical protein [Methylobacterium sp. E-045]
MNAPDPILTVIADHRAADDALTLILDTLDEDDEEAMRAHNRAADRCLDARRAMNAMVPVTMGGLQALVAHCVRYEEYTEGFERIGAALEGCESTLRFPWMRGGKDETLQGVEVANRPTVFDVIFAHRAAWDAFQIAPHEDVDVDAAYEAQGDMQAALDQVLITPCTNRIEALALLNHLRWWLAEEAQLAADYQPKYAIAEARVAELGLLLNGGVP